MTTADILQAAIPPAFVAIALAAFWIAARFTLTSTRG